jgi:hypothetical protein
MLYSRIFLQRLPIRSVGSFYFTGMFLAIINVDIAQQITGIRKRKIKTGKG